ncbi:hypothetical protein PROFUN_12934 [Planoprotostelium fungivorum]|uniref:Uncharacterized protein n=1 Tax=Planoprotostelium fungivorum TaxID=1890364 RepID=A0A2P6N5W4_9EUKA|nr:hypothetical protein PROFUN_12934 [Planoprotostelium fungivorum]
MTQTGNFLQAFHLADSTFSTSLRHQTPDYSLFHMFVRLATVAMTQTDHSSMVPFVKHSQMVPAHSPHTASTSISPLGTRCIRTVVQPHRRTQEGGELQQVVRFVSTSAVPDPGFDERMHRWEQIQHL